MFLSIIIPVYNVERYLKECVDSIASQISALEETVEVLLIDDGSTDNSGSICDDYSEKFSFITSYHKKNEGLLLTRRYGFSRAAGEYIMNLDSDDLMEPGAIRKIVNCAKSSGADMLFYNTYFYDNGKKRVWFENVFEATNGTISKERVIDEFLSGYAINSICTKVFKRTCIDLNRDYSGYSGYGEDSLQTAELLERANTFYYINELLYDYRCGSGMTAKFNPNYYLEYKIVCERIRNTEKLRTVCDFEKKLSVRYLSMVGRAITQSRWQVPFKYVDNKNYLSLIREDAMFNDMMKYYQQVDDKLQKDYRILLKVLINKHYLTMYILLKIKNIF